jgi:tetratricopeptide (TPR) repeat protein
MKKNSIRDFWIVLFLCYGIMGFSIIGGEETVVSRASALVNEGKADRAIEVLEGELQKNPQAADAEVILGMAYLQKSDFGRARTAFEKAVNSRPDLVAPHYNLAMLYEHEGNSPSALAEWKKVTQLSSDQNLKDLAGKHIKQLEGAQ